MKQQCCAHSETHRHTAHFGSLPPLTPSLPNHIRSLASCPSLLAWNARNSGVNLEAYAGHPWTKSVSVSSVSTRPGERRRFSRFGHPCA